MVDLQLSESTAESRTGQTAGSIMLYLSVF